MHPLHSQESDAIAVIPVPKEPMARRNAAEKQSKVKGVAWDKNCGKWRAIVWGNGKKHYLGLFAEERDAGTAVEATQEAAKEGRLGEHLVGLAEQRRQRAAAARERASGQ